IEIGPIKIEGLFREREMTGFKDRTRPACFSSSFSMNALPYQQPFQEVLLPLLSFLLTLHIIAWPLDQIVNCGLLGQIVVGIVWGPLTSWIALDVQRAIVQLGYIGLILL